MGRGSSSRVNPLNLSPNTPFSLDSSELTIALPQLICFPYISRDNAAPPSLSPVASFFLVRCPSFNKRTLKMTNNERCLTGLFYLQEFNFQVAVSSDEFSQAPSNYRSPSCLHGGCPDCSLQPFHRSSHFFILTLLALFHHLPPSCLQPNEILSDHLFLPPPDGLDSMTQDRSFGQCFSSIKPKTFTFNIGKPAYTRCRSPANSPRHFFIVITISKC